MQSVDSFIQALCNFFTHMLYTNMPLRRNWRYIWCESIHQSLIHCFYLTSLILQLFLYNRVQHLLQYAYKLITLHYLSLQQIGVKVVWAACIMKSQEAKGTFHQSKQTRVFFFIIHLLWVSSEESINPKKGYQNWCKIFTISILYAIH